MTGSKGAGKTEQLINFKHAFKVAFPFFQNLSIQRTGQKRYFYYGKLLKRHVKKRKKLFSFLMKFHG